MNDRPVLTPLLITNLLFGLLNIFLDLVSDGDRYVYKGQRDEIPAGIQQILLLALLIAATKSSLRALSTRELRTHLVAVSFLLGYGVATYFLTSDHRLAPGLAIFCSIYLVVRATQCSAGDGAGSPKN